MFTDLKMKSSVPGFMVHRVAATPEGLHAIEAIEYNSHTDNSASLFSQLLWPDVAKAESSATVEEAQRPATRIRNEFGQRTLEQILEPANSCWLVTEEASGLHVAYAIWQHHHGKSENEWAEIYKKRWRPAEMNHALADATEGAQILKRARILGSQGCMCKSPLCVSTLSQFRLPYILSRSIVMARFQDTKWAL